MRCNARARAPPRNCAGEGSVHCETCLGSGHQLAWLAFKQSERWEISVPVSNPTVIAHRALREARAIAPDDVATLTTVVERTANGPLDVRELDEAAQHAVRGQLAQIDPRLERIQQQQYIRLAALRRDVTFEMCGIKATLSLTGTQLAGATTPEVLRPIKRRLYAWIALCAVVVLIGVLLRKTMLGSSTYFDTANSAAGWFVVLAAACAIPALGAILRSWRGGLRFHPIRRSTKAWSSVVVGALASIVVVGAAARPSPTEIQQALASHDLARARSVVEAVKESGATRDAMDLEDRVTLAEAGSMTGDERLKRLDAVAARKGAAAGGAASDARALRLDEVRQRIAAHRPAEALAILDRWFTDDHSEPVAEERARAHEVAMAACSSIACQLGEAVEARGARTTPERIAAVDAARTRAVAALDPAQVDAKPTLQRLRQLRQLGDAGASIGRLAAGDADLATRAHRAVVLAESERAAVPLIGNDLSVAEELLGKAAKRQGDVPSIALDGVAVFLVLDRNGRATGLYAIGDKTGDRELKSTSWPASTLLSQTLGRPSTLPVLRSGETASRSYLGGTPVVVRWMEAAPVELRVGDATP
jgi:hypothetical protein